MARRQTWRAYVKLKVIAGIPGPPEDSDILITSSITDVRCLGRHDRLW